MSCCMSKAPAVGASGAIFGLVGSTAVFILRHRSIVLGSNDDLKHIANVICLLSPDIDKWGHLSGLLGGATASWFIGPAWKYESKSIDGRRVFVYRAPIFASQETRTQRGLSESIRTKPTFCNEGNVLYHPFFRLIVC